MDQFLLKMLGRKFCILFCGDDIRYRPIALKFEENKYGIKNFDGKGRDLFLKDSGYRDFISKVFRTASTNYLTKNIFSARSQSTLTLRPFYKLYMPLFTEYNGSLKKNNTITIVHAPSNSVGKNSAFIIESVEELKAEGCDFNFVLLKNQPNDIVLSTLASAHIAIDQFSSLPGRFALEAMFLGCAVLGGNKQHYEKKCDEIPVIDIILDKNDFKQKIKMLLKNPDMISEIGKKGRDYIAKYHNGQTTVLSIVNALENRTPPDQTPLWESKKELCYYCDYWYEKLLVRLLLN